MQKKPYFYIVITGKPIYVKNIFIVSLFLFFLIDILYTTFIHPSIHHFFLLLPIGVMEFTGAHV